MEIKDLEGNVVTPGDRIAGAFRIGNVAVLRTGTVQGFSERGNKATVTVGWDYDSSYRASRYNHQPDAELAKTNITGNIDASLFRFVKIGEN